MTRPRLCAWAACSTPAVATTRRGDHACAGHLWAEDHALPPAAVRRLKALAADRRLLATSRDARIRDADRQLDGGAA